MTEFFEDDSVIVNNDYFTTANTAVPQRTQRSDRHEFRCARCGSPAGMPKIYLTSASL